MKKILLFFVFVVVGWQISLAQGLSQNLSLDKINAQANALAKSFCNCIVDVGSSDNGYSYSVKLKMVREVGRLFYNYPERRITTTWRNGTQHKQPVSRYLNNLLLQSTSQKGFEHRKYKITWDKVCLNAGGGDWHYERITKDGCKIYSKIFRYAQTYIYYRLIDVHAENPQNRNVEYYDVAKKNIKVYAIVKPNDNRITVKLGDITRSEH